MLTGLYIEALLVDEELADQVWEVGEIDDLGACLAWSAGARFAHPRPLEFTSILCVIGA